MARGLAGALHRMVEANVRASAAVSLWAAARFGPRIGGLGDFHCNLVPRLLRPGLRVLDVGGGSTPTIRPQVVNDLGLHVVGLDISMDRLRNAPAGAYQDLVVGDVARVPIPGEYDLILSSAVLEHVRDVAAAIGNLARCLSNDGLMAHFIPCRNAPFAWINRLLGNRLARRVLLGLHPSRDAIAGFPAYYDQCVPSRLEAICRRAGLEVQVRPYYVSEYFDFCVPLHVLDVFRQTLLARLDWRNLTETFVLMAHRSGARTADQAACDWPVGRSAA